MLYPKRPPVVGSSRRRVALLTLIGLGIALALPPSATADLQRCTLDDMRRVSTAVLAWATDQTVGDPIRRGATSFDVSDYPVISHGDLEALLVPTYLASLPVNDSWGTPFDYRLDPGLPAVNLFAIRSLGADALAEGDVYIPGFTADENEDLAIFDGFLVRQPPPLPQFAQEFTFDQMRDVGTAMFSWLTDIVSRDAGRRADLAGGAIDILDFPQISHADLTALLVPFYLPAVPALDGWGHPYEYYVDQAEPLGTETLAIRSPGSDGATSGNLYTPGSFPFSQDEQDLVWADGVFVRFPKGGPIFVDAFESGDLCAWPTSSP